MPQDDSRKSAPKGKDQAANPFDDEGEVGERRSGEYSFVYHEVARITMVRKSIPARALQTGEAQTNDGKRDKPRE